MKRKMREMAKKYRLELVFLFFWSFIIVVLAFLIYWGSLLQKKVNELDSRINNQVSLSKETETYHIEKAEYYEDYVVKTNMELFLEKQDEDFMLYYHDTLCGACLEANVYVDYYFQLGYQEYLPIYFVSETSDAVYWDNELMVISDTPTLVYFDVAKRQYETCIGVNEIVEKLDQIVNAASEG